MALSSVMFCVGFCLLALIFWTPLIESAAVRSDHLHGTGHLKVRGQGEEKRGEEEMYNVAKSLPILQRRHFDTPINKHRNVERNFEDADLLKEQSRDYVDMLGLK